MTRLQGAAELQRPQPADAPRPRLGAAHADARPDPAAAVPEAPKAVDGRPGTAADDEIDRLRAELKAHPCHAVPRPRGPRPVGASAGSSSTATPQTLRRRIEQRTNTVARQFDRVCDVLTASGYLDGDTRHRPRAAPDADLLRHGPGRGRVAAARPLGRPRRRPSWPRRCRCWSSRPAGPTTPRSPRLPGGTGHARSIAEMVRALGRAGRARARPPARLPARARPRLRLGGVPLGRGRRARRRAQRDRPGGRRLRALDEAAARPGRPGGRRRRRHAAAARPPAQAVGALRRGVVAYSSLTTERLRSSRAVDRRPDVRRRRPTGPIGARSSSDRGDARPPTSAAGSRRVNDVRGRGRPGRWPGRR